MFSVLIYICRPKLESLCHIRADTGKHGDQTKNGTEETTGPGGNAVNVLQENLHDDGISSSKSTIIKHVLIQGEKVKHRVQRKYCFVPGYFFSPWKSSFDSSPGCDVLCHTHYFSSYFFLVKWTQHVDQLDWCPCRISIELYEVKCFFVRQSPFTFYVSTMARWPSIR